MPVEREPQASPLNLGGLNTVKSAARSYPESPDLQNVRWNRAGELVKRSGFTTYNSTAMTNKAAITGVAQFVRRDTTTRYTIVGDKDRLWVAPTTGSWTALTASQGATTTDYYDFAILDNELIAVNGVSAPQVSDGTANGTGALTSKYWQSKSTMPMGQADGGDGQVFSGGMVAATGASSTGTSGDVYVQQYEVFTDSWTRRTPATSVHRYTATGSAYDKMFVMGGADAGGTPRAASESWKEDTDTWSSITSITTNVVLASGMSVNSAVYVANGTTNGDAQGVTNNQKYDPSLDAWSVQAVVTTAKSKSSGASIGGNGFSCGGLDTASATVATNYTYNSFTNTWSTGTALTNGRYNGGAAGDYPDTKYYYAGGYNSSGVAQSTVYSYNISSNAWTTENSVGAPAFSTTARTAQFSAIDHYWLMEAGGGGQATDNFRMNVSPSAPTAFYVESFKGYLFLARTSTNPSRVFYSLPGDSHIWNPDSFIDVNPDDGNWITGMFVFDGRLYVTKQDTIYQIAGSVFDPVEGDQDIIPLANVPGTVSNRSIVVTDRGVYYLAKDGIRVFDGARSVNLSIDKINPTIAGYVQSRLKYCQGMWVKKYNEIWFSFTSTGSTHDTILAWNYQEEKWLRFTGMNCESMALVEDANGNDQLLFGTGDATDGKLYLADSTDADNASAINSYYRTGWFALDPTAESMGRYGYIFVKRSGNWNLNVDLYKNFDTSTIVTDANGNNQGLIVNLLSGNYATDKYFPNATDQLARLDLTLPGHHFQINFSNAQASQPWELYGVVFRGHTVRAAGLFV